MSLQTQNLSFAYHQNRVVLKDVNLAIRNGVLTGVLGLNGSGKTTLLKLLSGYLKPSSGRVLWQNKSVSDFSALDLARQIAFVPQDFPTDFPFRVDEFVQMGAFAWKKTFFDSATERVATAAVLEELALTLLASRPIGELSGGERQRALLARALVQNTPLILLDEPLNHLDLKHRVETLKRLKDLCRQHGKTIVAVMHDLTDVRQHFDDAILLKDAQLQFCGPVTDALTQERVRHTFDLGVNLHLPFL